MTNDNCRKFKQNQINFFSCACAAEDSSLIGFGEERLQGKGSLPATFFLSRLICFFANDNSRKLKQNQIMFCICAELKSIQGLLIFVKIG